MVIETVAEPPFASVTVSFVLKLPAAANVCDCVCVLSLQFRFAVPSPNDKPRLVIAALPWVDPEALNVTVSGAVPETDVAVSCAAGLVLVLLVCANREGRDA